MLECLQTGSSQIANELQLRMPVSRMRKKSSHRLLMNHFLCVAWQMGYIAILMQAFIRTGWKHVKTSSVFSLFQVRLVPGTQDTRRAAKMRPSWRGDVACFSNPSVCWIACGLFFWGYLPHGHTILFFAANRSNRRRKADDEAAAKQLNILLSSGWNYEGWCWRWTRTRQTEYLCSKMWILVWIPYATILVALLKNQEAGSPSLDSLAFSAGKVVVRDSDPARYSGWGSWRGLARSWSDA